jgi:hypothetical protein
MGTLREACLAEFISKRGIQLVTTFKWAILWLSGVGVMLLPVEKTAAEIVDLRCASLASATARHGIIRFDCANHSFDGLLFALRHRETPRPRELTIEGLGSIPFERYHAHFIDRDGPHAGEAFFMYAIDDGALIDTGSGMTLSVDPDVVPDRLMRHSGSAGVRRVRAYAFGDSEIAGMTLRNVVVVPVNVPNSSAALRTDHTLGADFLRAIGSLCFDMNNDQIDPDCEEPESTHEMILAPNGLPYLPVELDGGLYLALLDTGAEAVWLQSPGCPAERGFAGHDATGTPFQFYGGYDTRTIHVGGHELEVHMLCSQTEAPNVQLTLGSTFFSRISTLYLDFERRLFAVEP